MSYPDPWRSGRVGSCTRRDRPRKPEPGLGTPIASGTLQTLVTTRTTDPMRAPQPNNSHPGTFLAIWAYTATLAGITTLTWLFDGRNLHSISSPVHLAWPLLACGFALGHFATINVE